MNDLSAFTIDQFCQRNSISRSTYYKMLREGTGPRLMSAGGMHRISVEAESDLASPVRSCRATAQEADRLTQKERPAR